MDIGINICKKFPPALKEKLLNKEIELPDGTQIKYDKILVYRAVARSADDNHEVTLDDFKSCEEIHIWDTDDIPFSVADHIFSLTINMYTVCGINTAGTFQNRRG